MRYLGWLLFLVGLVGLVYYFLQWNFLQDGIAQAVGTDAYDTLYAVGKGLGTRAFWSAVICGLGLGFLLWPRWSRFDTRITG